MILEENVISGGLGSLISTETNMNISIIGINDIYVEHGSINELLHEQNLDVDGVCKKIKQLLKE